MSPDELTPELRGYVRGLIVERSFYVTRGERDRVAEVDAELRRLGVDPALADHGRRVEVLGGGNAAAVHPTAERRGPGRPRSVRD